MNKANNRRLFTVAVSMPADVTTREMADYIREAVKCWGGSFHPDDPLFHLDKAQVTVRPWTGRVSKKDGGGYKRLIPQGRTGAV